MTPRFALAVLGALLSCVAASPVDDELSLLQSQLGLKTAVAQSRGAGVAGEEAAEELRGEASAEAAGNRDLVLMHVPYNFGHTIEHVAMFGSGLFSTGAMTAYLASLGGFSGQGRKASWQEVQALTRAGGEVWGHLNPDLQQISNVTGCPLYYSPQKYWPKGVAAKYFGNRTVFGMLRDPYERAIAMARGMIPNYGASAKTIGSMLKCDVNAAVKQMMKTYLAGSQFQSQCAFLPQAEYFDGPYGITLPVNNREFPASMNKVFKDHDYPYMQVKQADIFHVVACPQVWAGNLDTETRSLVKQVYKRDFDLLCKHFGCCDREENACIYQVPFMCPPWLLRQGYRGKPLPNVFSGGVQLLEDSAGVEDLSSDAGLDSDAEALLRMAARGRLTEEALVKLAANATLMQGVVQLLRET